MGKIRGAELIACLFEEHGTDLTASGGGETVARAAQKRGLHDAMAKAGLSRIRQRRSRLQWR